MEAIIRLAQINDGDLGPGSLAVSRDALADLTLMGSLPAHVHVVPTYAGTIALEWNSAGVEYTAKLSSEHNLFMCIDDESADDVIETVAEYSPSVLRKFVNTGRWA